GKTASRRVGGTRLLRAARNDNVVIARTPGRPPRRRSGGRKQSRDRREISGKAAPMTTLAQPISKTLRVNDLALHYLEWGEAAAPADRLRPRLYRECGRIQRPRPAPSRPLSHPGLRCPRARRERLVAGRRLSLRGSGERSVGIRQAARPRQVRTDWHFDGRHH